MAISSVMFAVIFYSINGSRLPDLQRQVESLELYCQWELHNFHDPFAEMMWI